MFILILLTAWPYAVDYYPTQNDCLDAGAYLPAATPFACIPAPKEPKE